MEQQTLSVETRTSRGKGPARRYRMAGRLPGVLYGLGHNVPVVVEPRPIKKLLLEEGGKNKMLLLKGTDVEGKHVLVKDYQVDPVSRELLHVDLLEVDVTKKIIVTVTLNYTGKAIGVADGGVLNVVARTIDVKCLPTNIPKHIDVDVSALKIGDSIHLEQVAMPEGIEKETAVTATLVTVVPPTKEEEAAPSLAPTAEPEVITEKKAAAGEEGAAAEGKDAGGKDKKEEKKK